LASGLASGFAAGLASGFPTGLMISTKLSPINVSLHPFYLHNKEGFITNICCSSEINPTLILKRYKLLVPLNEIHTFNEIFIFSRKGLAIPVKMSCAMAWIPIAIHDLTRHVLT
jgi:hypothetical protein